MEFSLLLRLLAFGVIMLVFQGMASASSDATTDENKRLDAHTLIAMGTKLKNPLLRLVGFTLLESFKDVCKLQTCSDWSRWSDCSARYKGSFGTRTRSRMCGGHNSTMCKSSYDPVPDARADLCEGPCPLGYNMTTGGFCLKVIAQNVNHSTAEEICKTDGADLVHIDSKQKSDDVDVVMTPLSRPPIWINGRRASTNSPWEYRYGSATDIFPKWVSGEPDSTDLCNVCQLKSNKYWRYGRGCSYQYYAMCEFI